MKCTNVQMYKWNFCFICTYSGMYLLAMVLFSTEALSKMLLKVENKMKAIGPEPWS